MIYCVKYIVFLLTSTFNDCRVNISTCSNRDKKQKQKQKTKQNNNKKKKEKNNDRLTQNFEVCYTSNRIF